MKYRGEPREPMPEYNLHGSEYNQSVNIDWYVVGVAVFVISIIILLKTDWIETHIIETSTITTEQE